MTAANTTRPPEVLVDTRDLTRDEWLAWRRKGIGGSDAAAVLGMSPWTSPFALYLDKRGELPDRDDGEPALWGTLLEDVVAREFARRNGVEVRRRNAILQHPEHPFMLANLDREVVASGDPDRLPGRGILEVKTVTAYKADEWADDGVPDHVALQVQHCLAVTGRQWGYVAALIGGNDYRQRLVERDDELLDALIAAEAAFWQRVVDGDPPLPDGADSTTEAIAQLYADARPGSAVDLPVTAEELVAVYNGAAEAEKRAKAAKAEAANQLRALLGDAELGFVEGDDRPLVSWKNQPHRELDRKALAAEHPELVERFTTTTTRRVLRPRKA